MHEHKNQKLLGIVISYITTGFNFIINIIYTPVMISLLGKSEYGTYQLAASVVAYLTVFDFGFSSAYIKFYSRYKERKDEIGIASLNTLFLSVFLILSLFILLSGVIIFNNAHTFFGSNLTTEEIQLVRILFIILIINLAITFPSNVFQSYITANERFFFLRIMSLLRIVFNPIIALPLLFLGYRSVGLVLVTTGLTLLYAAVCFFYATKKLYMKFVMGRFDLKLIKEILLFSSFVFLNMLVNEINWNTDKYILGLFSGTGAVAVYSVASTLNTSFLSASNTISSVFVPQINRYVVQGNDEKINEIFIMVGRIQFVVLYLVLSGYYIFGKYFILHVYAGEGFFDSYIVGLLLMTPALIPLIQNIGIEVLQAKNLHKFRAVVYFFMALANIGISIPLTKRFGPIGAATGTTLSLIVGNGIFMNWYYEKKAGINIRVFWQSILGFGSSVAVMAIVGIAISIVSITSHLLFFLLIIVYTAVYLVVFYILGLNESEKSFIKSTGILKNIPFCR